MYIRGLVLLLFCLSFFHSSSCNVLHSLLNTSFSSPSLVQPRLSCPLPSLYFEIPSLAITHPGRLVLLSPMVSSLALPCLARHYMHGVGEPVGSMVYWVFCWGPGVPSWEKSPSWGGVGGAELEGVADTEHPKPMELRGHWDIVSSEG
jgi:hypothetical protein